MSIPRSRSVLATAACALSSLLADAGRAQVPVGSAVVGTSSGPGTTGTAGLFLVTLPGGVVTPITGLPGYLNSTGPTPTQQGVGSVAYRSSDGAIVVGTVAQPGGPTGGAVELILYYLNGSAVDPLRTRSIVLGTTTTSAAGAWVTVLPDDRILAIGGPCSTGWLATGPVIVDPATLAATPLPIPPIPLTGAGGGVTVDPTGRYVYLAATAAPGSASMVASLYRWDLATNTACTIVSWFGELIQGLTCDDDGTVYVSAGTLSPPTHSIHRVTPNGCGPATWTTTINPRTVPPSGLALDRASGQYLVAGGGFGPGFPTTDFNTLTLFDAVTLVATPVAGGPTVWGNMGRSVAVHNAIDSYGAPSNGLNRYWLANFPNPAGQPVVGNLGFALTVQSDPALPAPLLSVLALSFGRGSLQLLGIDLLVDATTMVVLPTFSLPIPNNPNLVGAVLTAQSVHVENNGALAASRGYEITVH
ncbi:MAG: hypothetical protein U1F36_22640 [Planctomycetota bacterium]